MRGGRYMFAPHRRRAVRQPQSDTHGVRYVSRRYVKRGGIDRLHSAELYGSVDRSVQLRGSETSDTARSVAMPISRVRHIPIRRNHFILFLYFR